MASENVPVYRHTTATMGGLRYRPAIIHAYHENTYSATWHVYITRVQQSSHARSLFFPCDNDIMSVKHWYINFAISPFHLYISIVYTSVLIRKPLTHIDFSLFCLERISSNITKEGAKVRKTLFYFFRKWWIRPSAQCGCFSLASNKIISINK